MILYVQLLFTEREYQEKSSVEKLTAKGPFQMGLVISKLKLTDKWLCTMDLLDGSKFW